jgi:hypothetical protein
VQRALATLAALIVTACSTGPATDWPEFPGDDAQARALVAARARRPIGALEPELDADAVIAALDRASTAGTLRVGWASIATELRAHRTVLFGVQHDSADQVRAFARLFGSAGTADHRLLALELFDASGRWRGLPIDLAQDGDDAALAAVRERGVEALPELRRRVAEGAYTAWKYDYVEDLLELAITARGAGQRVMGCDVPPPIGARTRVLEEGLRLRVREVHCANALADAGHHGPVAILFGDAHVAPEGLMRFLPEAPTRIHAIGGRRGSAGLEPALASRLAIDEPVLVPIAERRFVLLLPDARYAADGDRARDLLDAPSPRTALSASALAPCELAMEGQRRALGEDPIELALPPGRHALVVRHGALRLVTGIALDPGGTAELVVDPEGRRIHVRLASTAAAPPGSLDLRLPASPRGL